MQMHYSNCANIQMQIFIKHMLIKSQLHLFHPCTSRMDSPTAGMAQQLYSRGLTSDEMDLQDALERSVSRDIRDDLELTVPRDIRDDLGLNMGREEEPVAYGGELAMHPSLRDREYMSHGHLLGNILAQFPPGEEYERTLSMKFKKCVFLQCSFIIIKKKTLT